MFASHFSRALILLSVTVAGLVAAVPSRAEAQVRTQQGRRYDSPFGPTITPNLNFFRDDTGVLDVYNAIVRPDRILRRQQIQQSTAIATQGRQLGQVQGQVQGLQEVIIAPTGIGARFMDFSHFYSIRAPRSR